MRRGRRGRPLLLCPPCPPIGLGPETRPVVLRCTSLRGREARARQGRCARLRSVSGCQRRARRCHGRPAPAFRAPSGTEEPGHRSAKGARSQDRCRQAVLGRGSRHSAKPVSCVRLRGVSTVQSHRLCIPRLCFDQSRREPKQGGRHYVAHLLGGIQPVRACRILQRSTPVLVPFLLRGQVRLPVVLHGPRAVERGPHAVSSRHTPAVPEAPRGRGQRRERAQRASFGRGSRLNPGRQTKPEGAAKGQVKSPPSPHTDLPADQQKDAAAAKSPKSSTDSSASSPTESPAVTSSPSQPVPDSSSRTTSQPQSQARSSATSSASGSKLPNKSQAGPRSRAARSRANSSSQPQAPSQQRFRPSATSLGPSQAAHRSPASTQHPSSSSQEPPAGKTHSSTSIPMQPPNKTSSEPGDSASKISKSSKQSQKGSLAQTPTDSVVLEQLGSCQSESPLEYTSESTTEVTCSWPRHHPWLRYLQHCWRLKHLAC